MEISKLIDNHPCYNKNAKDYGRIHLPVAPKCNLGCNFCNRKYDCLNESRPGVTSDILTPKEAFLRTLFYGERLKNLSVAGIAGPGDALYEKDKTVRTFKLIKKFLPELHLCLSTNGLSLSESISFIEELKVKHVTVTVNGVLPEIVENIYSFALIDGKIYKGKKMAETIIERQLEGIKALISKGVLVKVNTVFIPGINDNHILEIGKVIKETGVFIHNIIPLIPVEDTLFWKTGIRRAPSEKSVSDIKKALLEIGLNIMSHCRQCRADAVGMLNNAIKVEKYIAVASTDGKYIDSHFGEAKKFYIYGVNNGGFFLKDIRETGTSYNGVFVNDFTSVKRVFSAIGDCKILLVKDIGGSPMKILKPAVKVIKTEETIESALSKLRHEFFIPPLLKKSAIGVRYV